MEAQAIVSNFAATAKSLSCGMTSQECVPQHDANADDADDERGRVHGVELLIESAVRHDRSDGDALEYPQPMVGGVLRSDGPCEPFRITFVPRRSRRELRHFVAVGSPELHRFVRRTLADVAGLADPHPARIAAAFATLCSGLHKELEPLFGKQAVAALFARALDIAANEHPWLTAVVQENGATCTVETMKAADNGALEEGLAAVLVHDIGLLSTFIGEDLVLPLVQRAWEAVPLHSGDGKTEGDE